MAISASLNKRLRARRDEDEDQFEAETSSDEMEQDLDEDAESNSEDEKPLDENSSSDDQDEDNDDEVMSDEQSTNSADDREAIQSEFRQISFGALAKAQESMGKKRKRGGNGLLDPQTAASGSDNTSSTLNDVRERLRIAREQKQQEMGHKPSHNRYDHLPQPSRSSKHAPAIMSSKMAVTRKRVVIEPPTAAKARDPRFDPTVAAASSSISRRNNTAAAENAYSFLDEYRVSEIKQLKEQLARTKDASLKEELKRAITSATDRQRAIDNRKREQEVLREHKQKERQLIREGKKSQPYYLKNSELKKEVLKKKYENMKSKDRAKALERRRKKVASKEKKDLPWARRGVENSTS